MNEFYEKDELPVDISIPELISEYQYLYGEFCKLRTNLYKTIDRLVEIEAKYEKIARKLNITIIN